MLLFTLAIGTLDQAMNFIRADEVNRVTYGGMPVVADWFTRHVPEGAYVVVGNVLHAEEINRYSGNHFENYWTCLRWACQTKDASSKSPANGAPVVGRGDRPVYFLEVSHDYWPRQAGYHAP